MDIRTATIAGKTFQVAVTINYDDTAGNPWDDNDCHGVVDGYATKKKPEQRVLAENRNALLLYNMKKSQEKALRDSWGHRDATPEMSKRQVAALAVEADFKYLKGYVDGDWWYNYIIVELLDENGNKTGITECLGGVESERHYTEEQVTLLIDELISGYGTRWDEVETTTYRLK